MGADNPAFSPVFFVFGEPYIHYISRHSTFNKNHLTVHSPDRLSPSGIIFHRQAINCNILITHPAKVNTILLRPIREISSLIGSMKNAFLILLLTICNVLTLEVMAQTAMEKGYNLTLNTNGY